MPTNRKRTARGRRGAPIDANDWAYLNDEEPENPFTQFSPDDYWQRLWAEYGGQITQNWAKKYPGTRPSFWWKHSAPRLPVEEHGDYVDCYFANRLIKPRLKISGSGTPSIACFNNNMYLDYGIPEYVDDVDENDPPVWESQLDYLKRHGLLLPGEVRRAK
jgi:hypothetical protein